MARRVLAIANNLKQASYRLRIEALVAPLAQRGIALDVQIRPRAILARQRLLQTADGYDAVILQRKLLGASDARLLARRARRVYFDVDDAVMYCNGPAGIFERWRTWRRFLATAANVDQVVAGNEYLADMFRRRGASACVLPTVVDIHRYTAKVHAQVDRPTLVWIGSHSTLPYLRELLPVLESMSCLKLLIIADEGLTSSSIEIEHISWSSATEAAALARGDIGIAPTPFDRWTEGKCGFKIVQYMAAGLPVIASPVGANRELVVEGKTGFLVYQASDWRKSIAALASDWELRARLGAAGRARAETHYTLERAVDFWEKLLHDA
jgi:glycosyltransferase involved in cell wall biosynthesis